MATILDEELEQPQIERLSRDDFIHDVFAPHYEAGEHVTIIGPTKSGKTTVAYQMLDAVATPDLPGLVLVLKPRDDTVKEFSKLTGFKKTETWPPVWNRGWRKKSGGLGKKRRGWVIWPKHSLRDIKQDNAYLAASFGRVLTDSYRRGNRIVFADEVVGLSKDLGLTTELEAIWSRGRSLGCGLWAASQRPFHAPQLMYSSAEHIILFFDPDKRDRDRFKEIGGIDPDLVNHAVLSLKKHEFLYIGRSMGEDGVSPAVAIVER